MSTNNSDAHEDFGISEHFFSHSGFYNMEGTVSSAAEKRIAVVTGGNKGIGLEICRQLASNGVKVVLTARDETRGTQAVEKLRNESGLSDVVFHQLDVTDASSIASLADFIRTHFGKLDILVNNAGIGGMSIDYEKLKLSNPNSSEKSEEQETFDTLMKYNLQTYDMAEECLKINYYGMKDVAEALIPLLLSCNSGRIVNVSSGIGKLSVISNERIKQILSDIDDGLTEERLDELLKKYLEDFKENSLDANGWPTKFSAYQVSKVFINAYTRILAKRYPKLCINCVNPGYVKTDINYNSGILTVEEGARGPVMLALLPDGSPSGLFYDKMELSTF